MNFNLNFINKSLDNYNNSCWLFKERRLKELSNNLEKELDALESDGIEFNEQGNISDNQKKILEEAASVSLIVLERLKKSSTKSMLHKTSLLEYKIQALQYRCEVQKGVIPTDDNEMLSIDAQFQTLIVEFKKNTFVIENKELVADDKQVIIETVKNYTDFARFILDAKNKELREQFFHSVIRNRNPVSVFIEYPNVAHRLKLSLLSPRVGRFAKAELLKIEKFPTNNAKKISKKVVSLSFVEDTKEAEVKRCNILDEKAEVDFKGQTGKRTVQSIFTQFSTRGTTDNIDFECFQKGVTPFNITQYKNIDFSKKENWYEDMPVFETIDLKTATERFGNKLNGTNWGLAVKGTTVYDQIDVDNTHVYLEIAIPISDDQYRIYCIGKFPKKYANTGLESFLMLGNTILGHVIFDQNVFYSNRRTYSRPFVIEPEIGKKMMKLITEDVKNGLEGNMIFQSLYYNCTKWIHSIIKEILPSDEIKDLFKINLLDTKPKNIILATIFKIIKIFPKSIQFLIIRFLNLLILPGRGRYVIENGKKVWKSITHSPFWKNQVLYQPIVGLRPSNAAA